MQTWKDNDIPIELQTYVHSWQVVNPQLEYMFWNDTQGMDLLRVHYPWFYQHMGVFKSGVEKADIMRYFILYHYGPSAYILDADTRHGVS
jgi:mannosyltransferase OCH1-like enzyme